MAIDEIERVYKISKETLLESLEAGLASAYKKEYSEACNVSVNLNYEKQTIKVYLYKTIVEEVDDYDKEIALEEAREIKSDYQLGDIYIEEIPLGDFSRIAAQTAKQVVMQRINDAKREMVVSEMNEKTGEILNATIRKIEAGNIYVEIAGNDMEGLMMTSDQIPGEKYAVGQNLKVFLKKIRTTNHGAQVLVSRSSSGFVKRLFQLEVPEVKAGLVQIKSIVREAGYRTKIAVFSDDQNVDATGACIGNKGVRVNAIVNELNGEKVDIIEYCEDPFEFIARALSPAQVVMVRCIEDTKSATAIVPDEKLSLAIGKSGQNARLAAKLTGWKIDVKPQSSLQNEIEEESETSEQENA